MHVMCLCLAKLHLRMSGDSLYGIEGLKALF